MRIALKSFYGQSSVTISIASPARARRRDTRHETKRDARARARSRLLRDERRHVNAADEENDDRGVEGEGG